MIIFLKKYDTIQISEEEKLIFPVTKGNTIKYYVHNAATTRC